MKKRTNCILILSTLCLLIVAFYGCGPRVSIRRGYDFNQIKRIGVLKFDSSQVGCFSSYDPGNAVADEFVLQLLDRDVMVIERSRLENIMKEQDLWKSGSIDSATVKKIGKLLGVDALIIGTVTKYIPDRKERFYLKGEQDKLREEIFIVNAEVGISARMVDVESGVVIWASSYTYDSFYMDSAIMQTVSAMMGTLEGVLPTMKKR
ncbi:MAG: CsgG/HfaB family protein [Elusimicrobiota bacterium]